MLNLDLPSLVWGPLVGKAVTRKDLEAIDSLCFGVLDKIANLHLENVTAETFSDYIDQNFVTVWQNDRHFNCTKL